MNKYILITLLFFAFLVPGCSNSNNSTSATDDNILNNTESERWTNKPLIMFYSDRGGENAWYTLDLEGDRISKLAFPNLTSYRVEGIKWIPGIGLFAMELLDNYNQSDYYLVDIEGNIRQRLTNDLYGESDISYSKESDQFVYVCVDLDLDICTIERDGTNKINLTLIPSREGMPHWSRSGEWILFVSNRSGVPGIFKVNKNSAETIQLSSVLFPESNPIWSNDDSSILFTSQRDGNSEIYTMSEFGDNLKNLTNHPASDFDPLWSPDESLIAFQSTRNDGNDIYIMNSDGSNVINITNTPGLKEMSYVWSLDGKSIIFASREENGYELFSIKTDSSGLHNLTNNSANDVDPQWIGFTQ